MSQVEFTHLLESLSVLSPDQLSRLRQKLDSQLAESDGQRQDGRVDIGSLPLTGDEQAEQALQLRLVEAGLLSEVKPPIRDLTPYRVRRSIPIKGEPLSETIIRERR